MQIELHVEGVIECGCRGPPESAVCQDGPCGLTIHILVEKVAIMPPMLGPSPRNHLFSLGADTEL
jgi:hypothetical protein